MKEILDPTISLNCRRAMVSIDAILDNEDEDGTPVDGTIAPAQMQELVIDGEYENENLSKHYVF